MKKLKFTCCMLMVLMFSLPAVCAFAAYDAQVQDVKYICDFAVEYVNSGSTDDFNQYMASKLNEMFNDNSVENSGKFVYLFSQDPTLSNKTNQLTKIVSVIGHIYVNGGKAKLTQDDINQNVTPDYGGESGLNDYEDDDAEAFMKVINEYKAKLSPVDKEKTSDKSDAMPPERNTNKDADKDSAAKTSGGASVGIVIFVSILASAIVFVAGTYALKQVESKNREEATSDIDNDDVFNLRLAVKSMQASLQKADGNFKELDKLRIQVDEMDEKLEHITEYLRKLNKTE